jgi:RNA polymerase sigma factor (sigma-70 family)
MELTAEHLRLVERVAFREFPQAWGEHHQDLIGAGHLGLVLAARAFTPGGSATFESFAWHRIAGAMRDHRRRMDHLSRHQRKQVTDGALTDPGAPMTLTGEHDATDPDNQYGRLLELDALHQALDCLPVREATMVRLYYLCDWTQRDIAALLGVSACRVQQLLNRELRTLRALLEPVWLDC